MTREVRLDVGPGRPEQRANDFERCAGTNHSHLVAWWQHGKAASAGATKEAHQHGFRAIFGVMGRRDDAGGVGRFDEGFPPRFARARLEIAAPRHVDAGSPEGDAVSRCELLREIELSRSFGTEPVVDAVGGDVEIEARREPGEDGEERHRVGAAADRDEDAGAGRETALAFERAARDREERGAARRRGARAHPLTKDTTVSTWLVSGNISKVSAVARVQPPSLKIFTSRASVGGSHET